MRASVLQIGEEYFAVVRTGRFEETILAENGRNIAFPTPGAALKAARAKIAPKPAPAPVDPDAALRERWKREKADELNAERDRFALRGVQVITKRRRAP